MLKMLWLHSTLVLPTNRFSKWFKILEFDLSQYILIYQYFHLLILFYYKTHFIPLSQISHFNRSYQFQLFLKKVWTTHSYISICLLKTLKKINKVIDLIFQLIELSTFAQHITYMVMVFKNSITWALSVRIQFNLIIYHLFPCI